MDDQDRIKELIDDVATWERLIKAEKAVFERRLKSKNLGTAPSDIARLDELIRESDKALRRLGKQKMLADTRLIRFRNGDTE